MVTNAVFSEDSKEHFQPGEASRALNNTGAKSLFPVISRAAMGAYLVPLLHLRAIMSSITSANSINYFKCIFLGWQWLARVWKGSDWCVTGINNSDSTLANSKGLVLIFQHNSVFSRFCCSFGSKIRQDLRLKLSWIMINDVSFWVFVPQLVCECSL